MKGEMARKSGWVAGIVTLASLTTLVACGDDKQTQPNDSTTVDTIFPDVPSDATDTTPDAVPTVRALEFKQGFGDDNQPCVGKPRCTIFLGFNEEKTLELRYTEDGLPVSGQAVKFALENDPNGIGKLNTLSTASNADGIAAVKVSPKQSIIGQFAVKAWIDNSTIPPKYFDVVVSPKGLVALTVVASYSGTRPVGTYSVNLYRQNAAGAPGCSDMLKLLNEETAAVSRDELLTSQSAKFPDFDNLEADGTQKYTILAYSKNQFNEPQAWACNATEGIVEWGKSKTVELELEDRRMLFAGAYEVTSRFDFVSAIPEPYQTYVRYVVGFFQSPTQTVFDIACDLLTNDDGSLNGFCDMLFDSDANGNVVPGTLGGFVFDLVDAILKSILDDTVFATVLQSGGEIADILTAFEITSTFTFKKEPNEDGVFAAGDTEENWYKVTFKWTQGANCEATEEGCGDRVYNMNAFQSAAVKGTFPASVGNFVDSFADLTIDLHPLNLRYGQLINSLLQSVVIPLLVGNSQVDSYGDLLGYLVGGGADCLSAQETGTDCCGVFADKVLGDEDGKYESGSGGDGADAAAVYAACSTIQTAAPGFLGQTLTNLDLSTGEAFQLGTLTPCRMEDANRDLKADNIGSLVSPCTWNVQLKFSDNAQTTIDAQFWGHRIDQ